MRHRVWWGAVCGLIAIFSVAASAQDAIDPSQLAAAVDSDPAVLAAGFRVTAAEAAALAARRLDDPQLRLAVKDLGRVNATPWLELGLRVPIPNPFEALAARSAGQVLVAARQSELALARSAAWQTLARLYGEAVAAAETVHAHDGLVAALRAEEEQVHAQRTSGLASSLDAVRVTADLARATLDQRSAVTRAAAASDALAIALYGVARPITVAPRAPPPPRDALTIADGPSFRALSDTLSRLGADRARAAHATAIPWLPWVQVNGAFEPGSARADVQLAVDLPVWGWGTGDARQAVADAQADAAKIEEARRERLQVVQAALSAASGAAASATALDEVIASLQRERERADASLQPSIDVEIAKLRLARAELTEVSTAIGWAVSAE